VIALFGDRNLLHSVLWVISLLLDDTGSLEYEDRQIELAGTNLRTLRELLSHGGRMWSHELAERLGVQPQTVNSYLRRLSKALEASGIPFETYEESGVARLRQRQT